MCAMQKLILIRTALHTKKSNPNQATKRHQVTSETLNMIQQFKLIIGRMFNNVGKVFA